MNDTVKKHYTKHKNKILPTTLVSVGTAMIVFFWTLDISRGDMKAIPGLRTQVAEQAVMIANMKESDAALLYEISTLQKSNEDLGNDVSALTAELSRTHEIQMVILEDIKRIIAR